MFSLNTITKLSDLAKLVGILVTEISTIIPDWNYPSDNPTTGIF